MGQDTIQNIFPWPQSPLLAAFTKILWKLKNVLSFELSVLFQILLATLEISISCILSLFNFHLKRSVEQGKKMMQNCHFQMSVLQTELPQLVLCARLELLFYGRTQTQQSSWRSPEMEEKMNE